MLKASLSSLIKQESGKRWLWVHMVCHLISCVM